MSFSDYFCYGMSAVIILLGIYFIISGLITDDIPRKHHGIILILASVSSLGVFIGCNVIKAEEKMIEWDNVKAFLEIACPVTLFFVCLVIIVWSVFKIVYWLFDKLYEKHKRTTPNDGCGWKKYYTLDGVYSFEYWHGDQDGTLYKIIDDKKRIIIKSHISIEKADEMMACYRKIGVYKEDKQ